MIGQLAAPGNTFSGYHDQTDTQPQAVNQPLGQKGDFKDQIRDSQESLYIMSSGGSESSVESASTAEAAPKNVSRASSTRRKSVSITSESKTNRSLMTPDEKKKHKDAVSLKYFSLMEKYGPKRKFLIEKDAASADEPAIEPVGFVIKFRLSHAYKALEKQEIEAAIPDIKPVRKRKHTKFLLPPDEKSSEPTETVYAGSERPPSEAGTMASQSSRRFQIRARLKNASGKMMESASLWRSLTKQKASLAQQIKEEQQRYESNKGDKTKGNQKLSGQKDLRNRKLSKAQQEAALKQKQIEKSLEQLKEDVRARQISKNKEMWNSHFQGINVPGSIGATEYCSTVGGDVDSIFRMFSDSMYSGSITMDALTISGSRPSSPSKSVIDASSRPSSAAGSIRRGKSTPKPRTSTPGPPTRPSSPSRANKSKNSSSSKDNSRSTNGRRKSVSATPVNKSLNDTKPGAKPRNLSAFLRPPESARGKESADAKSEKEAEAKKVLAPRKIEKYLYRMCNCHQVARKQTLSKLFKKKKVAGVIDLYGCPDKTDPRSEVLFCPFCSVLPRKRINTWLDNLEDDA